MRIVWLQGLSLAGSISAVAYVVAHAASAGCGGAAARPEPQAPAAEIEAPKTRIIAEEAAPDPDPACTPSMLPPTKAAPVFRPECSPWVNQGGKARAPQPPAQAAPAQATR
jgi:hypothetical protein